MFDPSTVWLLINMQWEASLMHLLGSHCPYPDSKGEANKHDFNYWCNLKSLQKIKIECGLSVQRLKTRCISITKTFIPLFFSWLQVCVHAGFSTWCSKLAQFLGSAIMEQVLQGAILLLPKQLDSVFDYIQIHWITLCFQN